MIGPLRYSLGFWLAVAACRLCCAADAAVDPPAKIQPVPITAEPLKFSAGEPMSRMALVTEPAKLTGALSWTAETRQHRGRVNAMALDPDCKLAATGGVDGAIRIWDLADGHLVRAIVGHDGHISSLDWSPDGNSIASGGHGDGKIRVWDARSGMPLRNFRSPKGYVDHVAWSPDGTRLLAAGGQSGWIWLWTVKSDEERLVLETGQDVRSIDWSPGGEQVAVSITQGSVSVVDVVSAKSVHVLDDPTTAHFCVRWSPDGKKLYIGSAGQSIIYDMPSGTELEKLAGPGRIAVWSPDSKILCAASNGGKARFWGETTRKKVRPIFLDGTELHWPKADQIFALDSTTITATKPESGKQDFQYVVARMRPPLFTPGKPIVTGLGTPTIVLWDSVTAEKLHALEGHTGNVTAVAWNRDGKLLASASDDKTVRLWETSSGELIETLKDHTAPVTAVAWSPDSKTLASAGYDQKVRLWQASGKPIGAMEGHTGVINAIVWAPRGGLLASGSSDNSIRLWRTERRQLATTITTGKSVDVLGFSPDGSAIAAGMSEGFVQLWSTANGRPIPKVVADQRRTSGGVNALAWSPDGRKMLVACDAHRAVDLWDLQTSKLVRLGTDTRGRFVNWSANGARMIAGTSDGVVQFWEGAGPDLSGLIFEEKDHIVLVSGNGNYRIDYDFQPDFVFVLQAEKEQIMLSVEEFAAKYGWKNVPTQVTFTK